MLAMVAFPPWIKITQHVTPAIDRSAVQTETQESAGYAWLFEPPKATSKPDWRYSSYESVKIDFGRLVVQWLAAAFLTATGLLYFKGSEKISLQEWWSSPTAAKSQPTTNPPIPTTPSLAISETQVPNESSKPRKHVWLELGIPLLIGICIFIVPHSFLRFLWFGQEEAARRENTSTFESSKAAAEKGDAWAQNNLGWIYEHGQGVPQSYEDAFKWFSKAAEQGDAAAQNNLGVMYQNGQAIQKDSVEAYKWYCLAAAQGYAYAITNRDNLIRFLTPDQLAEGQQRAAEVQFEKDFYEKYPDLKPYGSVVEAVALKLQASGYRAESREAVMEMFAKTAREELARRRGSSP